MADLLKSKITQAIVVALISALSGGLLMGYISLPKSVTVLEAKAAAFETTAGKHDARLSVVEKDYYPRRDAETAFGSLKAEMKEILTEIKGDVKETRALVEQHIINDR